MTRLMCSSDPQELRTLKIKLFQAGILSEIRSNPLAEGLGIARLEMFVDERDLPGAAKIRQDLNHVVTVEAAPPSPGGGGVIYDLFLDAKSAPAADPGVFPPPATEPPRPESPGPEPQAGLAEHDGEFAQATALLAKEVEELLLRESTLFDHCSSLEQQVKTLDESLAHARQDLAREASDRSSAEQQLAEVREARASLEKDIQSLEVRSNTSEQALAAAHAQIEAQTREANARLAQVADLTKEVAARDAQLESVAQSLAAARAGMEQEKSLRLAAEQKAGDLAAAQESIESQLARQTQQCEQLLSERRDEHERLRACVVKVNDLRSRLRAKSSAATARAATRVRPSRERV